MQVQQVFALANCAGQTCSDPGHERLTHTASKCAFEMSHPFQIKGVGASLVNHALGTCYNMLWKLRIMTACFSVHYTTDSMMLYKQATS